MAKKLAKKVSPIIIAIFCALLAIPKYTYAEQGDGGDIGGGCDGKSFFTTKGSGYGVCSSDGYGWVHFKYNKNNIKDIKFGPASSNSGGIKTISSKCGQYGGFWHYGFYVQKDINVNNNPGSGYTTVYMNGYSTAGNPEHQYGSGKRDIHYDTIKNNLSHIFYDSNKVEIARADDTKKDADVKTEYYEWLNKYGKSQGESDIWDSSLSWFCYGDGVKDDDATFKGTVTATVNGSSVSNNDSIEVGATANVVFSHTVKRENNGPDKKLTNHYHTTVLGGGNKLSDTSSKFDKGHSELVKTDSFSVPVSPGSSVTVCQNLHYDKKVKNNDTVDSTGSTGNFCVKLTRPAGGAFDVNQTCSVDSGAEHEGDQCNVNYNTNSQTWTIKHTSKVTADASGTVPAGKTATNNATYKHGSLDYGITDKKCVRSYSPFTNFWYYENGSFIDSGPTLSATSTQDLAPGHSGEDNKHQTGWHNGDCNNWDKKGNCIGYEQLPTYKKYESGCEDGRTYWQEFNNKEKTATYSGANLLLPEDRTKETVSTASQYTMMSVKANYSKEKWSGDKSSTVWNTVTRWRRHAHFRQGTTTFKADQNKDNNKTVATTDRANNYDLDVTNSNGRFIVTLSYALDRTNTDNVMDAGAENFTVKNQWSSKETIVADDNSGQIYKVNHEKVDGVNYGAYNVYRDEGEFSSTNANTNNVAGPKTHTISGMLYYGQKIKICGVLKYGDKVRELNYGGSEVESWTESTTNCITIHRDTKKCEVPGYNAVLDHQKGDNVAIIGAINTTTGMSDYRYTTWSRGQGRVDQIKDLTATAIWARPGDNIKYHTEYCMGANYAHVVHLADGRAIANGVDTTLKADADSTARRDNDTKKVNAIRRSHYLFGESMSKLSGPAENTKTTPIIFNFTKEADGTFNPSNATNDDKYIGKKSSPSDDANFYNCPNSGSASGATGYYQVAGVVKHLTDDYTKDNYFIDTNKCGSNRTQSLDVGRELNERITWTNMYVTTSGSTTTATVSADYASRAYVRVPYNYTAKPYVQNNSKPDGTVQIGGKMTTTPGISVYPRINCAFVAGYNEGNVTRDEQCRAASSYANYATVTKPTTVRLEAYVSGTPNRVFKTDSYVVRANTKSNLRGSVGEPIGTLNEGGTKFDNDYTVDVPNDIAPGDRVCVKMTITPADSHNNTGRQFVYGASQNYAASEDTTNQTKTFYALREDGTTSAVAVSCSTAVKRPTVSIEDSNLYSATNIKTSVVSRKNSDDNYYLFGSWSEYGIFGNVVTGSLATSVSTQGMASGASYGYPSGSSFWSRHNKTITPYNLVPKTVVTYTKGGSKSGTHYYNYTRLSSSVTSYNQYQITYEYTENADGTHQYVLKSKGNKTISLPTPPSYNIPKINAENAVGSAQKDTKICIHATQTFANVNCDDNKVGSNNIGADAAANFYDSIIDRYSSQRMTTTDTSEAPKILGGGSEYIDVVSTKAKAEKLEAGSDENSAFYKYPGNDKKIFLGYADGTDIDYSSLSIASGGTAEGIDLGQSVSSVVVYRADTVVINSSIIANSDKKTGPGDFRMPIIIANKVWITGTPKQIDAVIIAKEQLNTCKWNNYESFLNNIPVTFPQSTGSDNSTTKMNSNLCTNELRFTAPVVVKGKLILNRTAGAGGGSDQTRRAEIFELNPATYLWSYHEMSRYSQATTTYSRELPSRY